MDVKKTHSCGELKTENVNQNVHLVGWIKRIRDHGNKKFIDLRDRKGITQILLSNEITDNFSEADDLGKEYLIKIQGEVNERPEGTINDEIVTGEIEVHAKKFDIISESKTPPFLLEEEKSKGVDESLRFEHRYLDLRKPSKSKNIINRHNFFQSCRRYLSQEEFIEVETPFLTKSTPEGARDFLVPARNSPGSFYALPQSPQLFKQLLMVSGLERYFQFAKCFRDEDTRKDRQFEFTQLDIEMSFLDRDELIELLEEMLSYAIEETYDIEIETPFPRMEYDEAINRYGTDRPDLRFGMELVDLSDIVSDSGFDIFSDTVNDGGVVKAIKLEDCGDLSNNYVNKLEDVVKDEGGAGIIRIKVDEEPEGPMLKHIEDSKIEEIIDKMDASKGDQIFIVAGETDVVNSGLGQLRLRLGKDFDLIDEDSLEFLWVVDFPLFSEKDGQINSEHHPFTSPKDIQEFKETDVENKQKLLDMKADAYDIVLNGFEIGGGSKRIHLPDVQQKVFDVLGLDEEEVDQRFGWFLEAYDYGPPPHRGIAFGVDRILMILEGEPNIREVIPFPKSKSGLDYLTGAPAEPRDGQLDELGIEVMDEFVEEE